MVERFRHDAFGQWNDPNGRWVRYTDHEAELSDLQRQLSEAVERAEKAERDRDEAQAQRDAAEFGARHGETIAQDAMHAVRELLKEAEVPLAAFIDDHVGNAIVQRNQERARATAAEARADTLAAEVAGQIESAYREGWADAKFGPRHQYVDDGWLDSEARASLSQGEPKP